MGACSAGGPTPSASCVSGPPGAREAVGTGPGGAGAAAGENDWVARKTPARASAGCASVLFRLTVVVVGRWAPLSDSPPPGTAPLTQPPSDRSCQRRFAILYAGFTESGGARFPPT